ncbi:MAG: hypothetical protein WAU75_09655 [Solirubrobacteraceae bacterium]
MRLRPLLVAMATSLLVAACGGSSHGSGSSSSATDTPTASSQTTTSSAISAVTGTYSVSGNTAVTSTTVVPPEVPKSQKQKHHRAARAASQGAHVQTSMTVNAAGDVSPPVVSVPSGVGVEIHVTNHGSAADTVALAVPSHPSVKVAPGASGTLETAGLKDGTYHVLVNGTPRGQLLIGAQGGP